MITVPAVKKAIGIMSLMKFFPGDEDSRGALMEMLGEMCQTDEQILWLARRMRNLYAEWPGAHELRAAYCSKYYPKDNIEAGSAVYLEGIPSEKPQRSPDVKALPPADSEAGKLLAKVVNGLVKVTPK